MFLYPEVWVCYAARPSPENGNEPVANFYTQDQVDHAHAAAREEVERLAAMVRELEPDAERWETLVAIGHEATELLLTQDEDGTWSIAINESVENAAGHWNGDTPDAAIDAARGSKP